MVNDPFPVLGSINLGLFGGRRAWPRFGPFDAPVRSGLDLAQRHHRLPVKVISHKSASENRGFLDLEHSRAAPFSRSACARHRLAVARQGKPPGREHPPAPALMEDAGRELDDFWQNLASAALSLLGELPCGVGFIGGSSIG